MALKIAFAGFRHDHICAIYHLAQASQSLDIVAACEPHAPTRSSLESQGIVFTHDDYPQMLAQTDCDIVAVGDYYTRRGRIVLAALQAGKHVFSDKPLCTDIDELTEIEKLAHDRNLALGCSFALRSSGNFLRVKELTDAHTIGNIVTIAISGQHALSLESRAPWYFQPGKHGGTINDIGVHAVDLALWLTAGAQVDIVAARQWNAKAQPYPHFPDAAQFMFTINRDMGADVSVMADVSYLAPTRTAYSLDNYWRLTIYGDRGFLETSYTLPHILLATDDDEEVHKIPKLPDKTHSYWDDFLHEVQGRKNESSLTTSAVLAASRQTLLIQQQSRP